jgi:hypothetical protein
VKRFILLLVAIGGGILAIGLSAAVAKVGNAHDSRVPWLVMFLVSLSYAAIPALDATAQLLTGLRAVRIVRRIVLIPLIVTVLVALIPVGVAGSALLKTDWQNLIGSLIAALIFTPFAWYYRSLYRRLGRTLTDISEQTKRTNVV